MTKGYNLARWLSTLAFSTFSHTGDVLKFLRLDLHYHELHLMAPVAPQSLLPNRLPFSSPLTCEHFFCFVCYHYYIAPYFLNLNMKHHRPVFKSCHCNIKKVIPMLLL